VLYRQSDIPEVMELVTILAAVTPKGLMDRSHAYKAAIDKNRAEGRDPDADVNMGLYTYPLLMAADILTMQADIVPVGRDQVQHLEFTRDMAGYFNHAFTPVFKLPEYKLERVASAALVPGIDGRKMSTSYGNHIPVFIESGKRRELVMKIVTDSRRPEEPKNPDENVIFRIYSHFATPAEVQEMRAAFEKGGLGYGDAKQKLYVALERTFEAPTKTYNSYMADRAKLDDILEAGALRARRIARETLSTAREAIGLKRLKAL
jgi:tryptophanyl-tRNA synthetase